MKRMILYLVSVIAVSTSPSVSAGSGITVSGAGTSSINGFYVGNETYTVGGKPFYSTATPDVMSVDDGDYAAVIQNFVSVMKNGDDGTYIYFSESGDFLIREGGVVSDPPQGMAMLGWRIDGISEGEIWYDQDGNDFGTTPYDGGNDWGCYNGESGICYGSAPTSTTQQQAGSVDRCIFWDGTNWNIADGVTGVLYYSNEDVATPDLVTIWYNANDSSPPEDFFGTPQGASPSPSVSAASGITVSGAGTSSINGFYVGNETYTVGGKPFYSTATPDVMSVDDGDYAAVIQNFVSVMKNGDDGTYIYFSESGDFLIREGGVVSNPPQGMGIPGWRIDGISEGEIWYDQDGNDFGTTPYDGGNNWGCYNGESGICYGSAPTSTTQQQTGSVDRCIFWDGTNWNIADGVTGVLYYSNEDVATPDLVTTWYNASDGSPPADFFATPQGASPSPSVH